jgi:hypothetical protein
VRAYLLVAIAAQHGADLYGRDMKPAFLYGDMTEDEDVYVKRQERWFEWTRVQIQEGDL